jgi:hypothetical protein
MQEVREPSSLRFLDDLIFLRCCYQLPLLLPKRIWNHS